jgi:ATP-dependent Lon protease
MKGYMASGQFSRGKENIRAEGSLVMVGNFDVDVRATAEAVGTCLADAAGDARRHCVPRSHPRLCAGLGLPETQSARAPVTDHFGLVSDFLSECWDRLRAGSRVSVLQGRVHFGGALSGRDIEAVNKTVSGLTKLAVPGSRRCRSPTRIWRWIVRMALEARRRVKEQQKRVFKSEFRNTHFSYILGVEGVEQFVATPEQHSDEAIEATRCRPVRSGRAAPGRRETGRASIGSKSRVGPGSGVKILNQPTPPAFRESVEVGEQNLYTRARRSWSATATHARRSSRSRCARWTRTRARGRPWPSGPRSTLRRLAQPQYTGRHIVVVGAQSGRFSRVIPNAIRIVELAIDKQAQTILMPVAVRRQLNDLPDELWTKISIEFYKDGADAVFKALVE